MNSPRTDGEKRSFEADEPESKSGSVPPLRPVDRFSLKSSPTSPASASTKGRLQSDRERCSISAMNGFFSSSISHSCFFPCRALTKLTGVDVPLCTTLVIAREEGRLRKWRKMIGVGGTDWKHYVRRNPQVVKRRIRKGVPDCLRGLVWQLTSGSRDLLLMNQGVYEVLFVIQISVVDSLCTRM